MTEETALAVVEAQPMVPRTPKETVEAATEVANAVAQIVTDKHLSTKVGTTDHVHVEGWTTMLAIMGITPREVPEQTHWDDDKRTCTATVELVRMADEAVVGRGTAECSRDEANWCDRAAFQIRSMAVTRATGKAARLAFSWIMVLAGYSPTPAEEMIDAKEAARTPAQTAQKPRGAAKPSEVPCIPGGREKGTPINEASTGTLIYWLTRMKAEHDEPAALDCRCAATDKAQYHERNYKQIQQYEAEIDTRGPQ